MLPRFDKEKPPKSNGYRGFRSLTDVNGYVNGAKARVAAGASFESFVIEEIIRGFQCTMKGGIDFYFYRTRDKSEIDLIVDGSFGLIPIEVKLGTKIKQRMLGPMKSFIKETDARFGILVNNSEKIEIIADDIIQIPAQFL